MALHWRIWVGAAFLVGIVALGVYVGRQQEARQQRQRMEWERQQMLEARKEAAEKLLYEGKYETILTWYADTPVCSLAIIRWADQLNREDRFEETIERFPQTDAAQLAREMLKKEEEAHARGEKSEREIRAEEARKAAEEAQRAKLREDARLAREYKIRPDDPDREAKLARARETEATLQKWKKCREHPGECLEIGMHESDVRHVLGPPDDVNRTTFGGMGRMHTREQWIYEISANWRVYVYIQDHELIAWQD